VASTGVIVDPFPAQPFSINVAGSNPPDDDPDYVARNFRGDIDDVRLYNRPLTADEVKCLAYRCTSDIGGDCFVDLKDLAAVGAGWQEAFDINDLVDLANIWLSEGTIFPLY
jgi:hypothetical protein